MVCLEPETTNCIVQTQEVGLLRLPIIKNFYFVSFSSLSCEYSRVIRLTTPLLNYVIVGGAVFMYVSVFFGVLPTIQRAVVHMQCIVSPYTDVVGNNRVAAFFKLAIYIVLFDGC